MRVLQLPLVARIYVSSVVAAGTVCLAAGLTTASFAQPWLLLALIVVSSVCASLKVTLPLTAGGSTLSVSYAVNFIALLLLGPEETMLVGAASALSQCLVKRREEQPLHRTLFSMASLVLTVQATGTVLRLLQVPPPGAPVIDLVVPLLGGATVYFLTNTGFVAAAIATAARDRVWTVWQANFLWGAPAYFIGAVTAAVVSWSIASAGYWLPVVMFAPVYLTFRSYQIYIGRIDEERRQVKETSDLHLATIEALTRAIDAKDQAPSHIRRVQHFAVGLAQAVGLSSNDVKGVKAAAMLHDIGKLAVPEHILSKAGPLTPEEFEKVRIHPLVGAEIIAAVPFPYPVAPLILSHHERWDGKGYPNKLAGTNIPVGARILSIVDYYDAVTTERPYHKAMNHEGAVGLLKHEAGRALDPALVETFIGLLPGMLAEFAALKDTRAPQPLEAGRSFLAAAESPSAPASRSAYETIAHAHREIYALYEIAQTMGTTLGLSETMALVSEKLRNLVPWSACAVFLQQPDGRTVKCQFAAGVDAPKLLEVPFDIAAGLSGCFTESRRTLVNADPVETFIGAGVGETTLQSALVTPLYSNGDRVIGCLALYHLDPQRYTDDHRRLLERVAAQAGPVVANSLTFAQTKEEALTDQLTGLPNRRSLFSHLSREIARAERLKSEVGLLMMDLDNFKTINDTYGHHIGDQALQKVAAALQSGLRPYDMCVRYAGDEFIIVLTECSRELADIRQRELQERVGGIELEIRPGKTLRLGASVGAAVYPHDGTNYEALLADADHRMYRDKAYRRRGPAPQPMLNVAALPSTPVLVHRQDGVLPVSRSVS